MLIRAIGLLKEVYDWFSFSQQAFSWLGLAQRAAAVTATAAVVAAPVVVATKPWQPDLPASFPGLPQASKPGVSEDEVRDLIQKIDEKKNYSRAFLLLEENRPVLAAILHLCATTPDLPIVQCEAAESAKNSITHKAEYMKRWEGIEKGAREQKQDNRLKLPAEHFK